MTYKARVNMNKNFYVITTIANKFSKKNKVLFKSYEKKIRAIDSINIF